MAVDGSAVLPAAVQQGAPADRSGAVESPLPEEQQAKAVAALSAAAATAAAAAAAADAARHSAAAAPAAGPAAAEPEQAEAAQQPAAAEAPSAAAEAPSAAAAAEAEAPDAEMAEEAEAAPVIEQATEAAAAAGRAGEEASTAAEAAPAAAAPARVPARALYGLPVDGAPAAEQQQPQRGEGPAGAERPPHLPYLPRTEDDGRLPAYALGLMEEWQGDAAAVRVRKGDHSEEDPPPGMQPVDVFIGAWRRRRRCGCP